MNHSLVDQFEQGAGKLRQSIAGLTPEDLLVVPIPGKWSTQQVVIHLADAEAAIADRIRRIIAMDDPALLAWEEKKFAERLFYDDQSANDAVEWFDLTRRQLIRILRKLPESALQRAGVHNDRGRQTLADILSFASWHLDHHLKFIAEKREKMGKLMW